MVRPEYPEPQPIGPRDTQLLAVSSKGELAVLLDARYVWYRLFTGTLARMPLGGGAPREVQEGCGKPTGRRTARSLRSFEKSAGRIGWNIRLEPCFEKSAGT
jgi:hypothetical protein